MLSIRFRFPDGNVEETDFETVPRQGELVAFDSSKCWSVARVCYPVQSHFTEVFLRGPYRMPRPEDYKDRDLSTLASH